MEDIFELIKKAKAGDNQALDTIVKENSPLIWSVVKRFIGYSTEADDLFQIGAMGLIKSVQRFDLTYGVKFSTYAVPMIMGEIKRFLRDDGVIKVSRSIKENSYKAKYAKDMLCKELGRDPTLKEIAKRSGITVDDLVIAFDATTPISSLNQKVEDSEREFGECLTDKTDMEENTVNKIAISDALKQLNTRDQKVIKMRYFMDQTQTQISKTLGISQVQVSRIEKRVLAQLGTLLSNDETAM